MRAWRAAHPQVEVITRDRWPAYIQAATSAAPQAKQVADRFHQLSSPLKVSFGGDLPSGE
jgi:transposase